MIELTHEEAMTLIKRLSTIEGFLLAVPDSREAIKLMDWPIELICNKMLDQKRLKVNSILDK